MIDLREKGMKESRTVWGKWKAQLGIGYPVRYSCRNIGDYLAHGENIENGSIVTLPQVRYSKVGMFNPFWKRFCLSLEDMTGELEVWVQSSKMNGDQMDFLEGCLNKEAISGTLLYDVQLVRSSRLQGVPAPIAEYHPNPIYLRSFELDRMPPHDDSDAFANIWTTVQSMFPSPNIMGNGQSCPVPR